MSEAITARKRSIAVLGGALLLVVILAAYGNHFQNSFHFDDAHTIETNAAIRDLRNIPLFFRDATTFSSLPSNQSYRPLVSTLLAVDYSLGHGLQPCWFHLSIFALFVALVLLVAFFIYRLIDPPTDGFAVASNLWIALGAAALYGLHPANADTVNYIIASSEVISTLGVVASFAVYFRFPNLRRYYIYVLPAAIAVLAKPTAAIFPLLFGLYSLLFSSSDARPEREAPRPSFTELRRGKQSEAATTTRLQRFVEMFVPFLICGAVLFFVARMTPHSWVAGAANTHNYLLTQPYVALLYFKTFFWPSDLSADYDLNPFTTTDDPRFWAGFAFAVLLVACAITASIFKKTRLIGFGLLWFVIALLPTSLLPLAEVMNDHRTFLPYVGLVIALAGSAAIICSRLALSRRGTSVSARRQSAAATVLGGIAMLIFCVSGYATFQRNKVWKSEETLWHDVTLKSPRNGRGLMNYGLTLMAKSDYNGALDYFHRAQQLTPNYSVLFINLAIAEDATKQSVKAEQHFKDALRLAPTSPDSYTYYARYLLSHSRADEARAFLQSALQLSPSDVTARDLLAKANDQIGNQPPQTPEYYLDLSLQRYREERYAEAIAACQNALKLRPDYAEASNNICAACNKLGRYKEAAAACEEALRSKPDFELARNNLQYAREKLKPSQK